MRTTHVHPPSAAALAALVGIDIDRPESWRDEALCAQIGGDSWFPEKGGSTREAKRICNGGPDRDPCPVRDECLTYALDGGVRFGIWGGLSERELRRLRKPTPAPVERRTPAPGAGSTVARRHRLDELAREAAPVVVPVVAPEPVRERPGVTRPWTRPELARAVRLLDEYGMRPADIAAELHVTAARVRGLLPARRSAA